LLLFLHIKFALKNHQSNRTFRKLFLHEESEKVLELTKHYNALKKPHFQKRTDALAKIPNFWLTTFLHHDVLAGLITEEEEDILRYLISLEVEDAEDVKSGFKIILNFKKNPYFTNSSVWKQYAMSEEGETKLTASQIHWKKDKDPTKPKEKKEEKGGKRSRDSDEEAELSFFSWFKETDEGGMDELAEVIKEELWPNPVAFYHIVEVEGDDDDDELGGEEEEEEEEGAGEEEEEEEEGED